MNCHSLLFSQTTYFMSTFSKHKNIFPSIFSMSCPQTSSITLQKICFVIICPALFFIFTHKKFSLNPRKFKDCSVFRKKFNACSIRKGQLTVLASFILGWLIIKIGIFFLAFFRRIIFVVITSIKLKL